MFVYIENVKYNTKNKESVDTDLLTKSNFS